LTSSERTYVLVALLLMFLAVDVALATWLLTPPLSRQYVVQPGETLADVAQRSSTHQQAIVAANGLDPGTILHPGRVLSVPAPPLAALGNLPVIVFEMIGALCGVLISHWLSGLAGLLVDGFRGRTLAVSSAVAMVGHLAGQVSSVQFVAGVTPTSMLNAVVAGFAWSLGVPLIAYALEARRSEE
jgi:LysM repeat protein